MASAEIHELARGAFLVPNVTVGRWTRRR
jgi:hypothetical protein